MRKIAKAFIFLAVAFLFWRRGIIRPYTVMPFEVFIILAGIVTFLSALISKTIRADIARLKSWLAFVVLILLFLLIGSINGYRNYGINETVFRITLTNLFYLGAAMLGFLLVAHYGGDEKFIKRIPLAFFSGLIYLPLVYFPDQKIENFFGLLPGIRAGLFYGLVTLQTDLALLLTVPLAVSMVGLVKTPIQRPLKKVLYWVAVVAILSLIFHTGSRAGWGAAAISSLFAFIYHYYLKTRHNFPFLKKLKYFAGYALLALVTLSLPFLILPPRMKIIVLDRIFPQATGHAPDIERFGINKITLGSALKTIINNPLPSLPYQERSLLWTQGIKLFSRHPLLGAGIAYPETTKAITGNAPDSGKYIEAHNILLQAVLSGGLGLLTVMIVFAWKIFSRIKNAENKDALWLTVAAILAGFLLPLMVNDTLFYEPFWVIAALAASQKQKGNVPTTT